MGKVKKKKKEGLVYAQVLCSQNQVEEWKIKMAKLGWKHIEATLVSEKTDTWSVKGY